LIHIKLEDAHCPSLVTCVEDVMSSSRNHRQLCLHTHSQRRDNMLASALLFRIRIPFP
jgi:hypothetical protein